MTDAPQEPQKRTRVGIVGAGIMASAHADALASHPAVELAGVYSRSPESTAEFAATHGMDAFDDLEALLSAADLVSVTTPDHVHADIVVAAADRGVDVICEKPFTTDLADADRALRAVRAAGITAMVLFNHRWVPAYAQAKEICERGELGEVRTSYARKNDRIHVPTEMLDWAAGTTPAWFLSSHDIDLVSWFLDDEVVEVYASAVGGTLRDLGVDTEDATVIQARYRRGTIATFEASWIYPDGFPTMTDSFLQLVGSAGTLRLDRLHEAVELYTERVDYPRNQLVNAAHGVPGGAVRNALFHAVDCSRSGAAPLVTLESSRNVTAVLQAAHESMLTRSPVVVSTLEEAGPR